VYPFPTFYGNPSITSRDIPLAKRQTDKLVSKHNPRQAEEDVIILVVILFNVLDVNKRRIRTDKEVVLSNSVIFWPIYDAPLWSSRMPARYQRDVAVRISV